MVTAINLKKFWMVTLVGLFGLTLAGCMHKHADGEEHADDNMSGDVADVADDNNDADDMEADVVIDISGKNFEFDVTKIEVNEGDVVTINFESEQGFHDWVVDEFDAATEQVNPGTPTSVTFVADQAGTFEFYCSVMQHRAQGMVGELIVKPAGDDNAEDEDAETETGEMADDEEAAE